MAIQMRRGLISDLDASKLVPGEFVMGTDANQDNIGIAKSASDVTWMATKDDLQEYDSEVINETLVIN